MTRVVIEDAKKEATRGVQLSVKLIPEADPEEFISSLRGSPGVRRVDKTFPPQERDPDLATLFVVEIDPSVLKATLDKLRANSAVEYAEEPAPRKLIR